MAIKTFTHSELVEIGYKWLLNSVKCGFALKELVTYADETPDVIGWKNNDSILIECKTSRADFKADAKKYFREYDDMGAGNYRFYLVPSGLLVSDDIPDKWGWLEVDDRGKIIKRIAPKGNIWGNDMRFDSYWYSESLMMKSALRRVQKNGDLIKIFKVEK
jgi:hypothetical protein